MVQIDFLLRSKTAIACMRSRYSAHIPVSGWRWRLSYVCACMRAWCVRMCIMAADLAPYDVLKHGGGGQPVCFLPDGSGSCVRERFTEAILLHFFSLVPYHACNHIHVYMCAYIMCTYLHYKFYFLIFTGVLGAAVGWGVAAYRQVPPHLHSLSLAANFAVVSGTFFGNKLCTRNV